MPCRIDLDRREEVALCPIRASCLPADPAVGGDHGRAPVRGHEDVTVGWVDRKASYATRPDVGGWVVGRIRRKVRDPVVRRDQDVATLRAGHVVGAQIDAPPCRAGVRVIVRHPQTISLWEGTLAGSDGLALIMSGEGC